MAPAIVAAALMPYLAMLALGVLCLPLLFTVRADPAGTLWRIVTAVAGVAVVSWVLGFVGGGGRTSGIGYGLFTVDLAFLLDSKNLSRVWPDVPASYTHEGLGFLGLPLLVLAVTAFAVWAWRRLTPAADADRAPGGRAYLRPLWLAVGLMFAYATLPVVRVARHEIVDLTAFTDLLGPLTSITRSSGRFAWPLLWLIGLTALRCAARLPARTALAVVCAVAVLQVADAKPPPRLESADHGAEAEAVIRTARADGATHLEFQPPFVTTDCTADGWGDFANIAALAIAAGAAGMTVNSGYPSRGSDRYLELICREQAAEFAAGRFRADVLYAVPPGNEPGDPRLHCVATAMRMSVCRTTAP